MADSQTPSIFSARSQIGSAMPCQCGDVNGDGRVNGVDGTLIARADLRLPPGIPTLIQNFRSYGLSSSRAKPGTAANDDAAIGAVGGAIAGNAGKGAAI